MSASGAAHKKDECYRALRLHACGMCRSLPLACAKTPELDGMLLLSVVMVVMQN